MDQSEQYGDNVTALASAEHGSLLRVIEALLFASNVPLSLQTLEDHLPQGVKAAPLLQELQSFYGARGVNLVESGEGWIFRTADDLSYLFTKERVEARKLSGAALETLAIIAYHQPATRAEIEQVRGVGISKGTLDVLLETGWVKMRGRRRAPGRPVTYGTTSAFLVQFDLANLSDLPGLRELKGAGLLSNDLPDDFEIPDPHTLAELQDDELPLDEEEDQVEPDLFDEDDQATDENEMRRVDSEDGPDEPKGEDKT